MYLIAERLKRPMRKFYGGKWVSFLGIPPFTLLFALMMIGEVWRQRAKRRRREQRLRGNPKVNKAFIGSWF
jgi:hypothetical protein